MAVLAFAAAGSMIGGAIGGTFLGVAATSWGWGIGTAIGNALFPTTLPDQNIQGPRFSDLKIQTSAYGQMIPIVYGTMKLTGNIIWARPIREVSRTDTQSGGKGGSSQEVSQTTYSYYADFAVALCEGEIVGIRKIWANGELVYNVSADATSESIIASSLPATAIRVYPGSETQEVDSLISSAEGTLAPAYRGTAYVVFEGLNVTNFQARVPQLEFEVVTQGTEATLAVVTYPSFATVASLQLSHFSKRLGRLGNLYAGSNTTGRAYRINFYSNSIQATHEGISLCIGLDSRGEGAYVRGTTLYLVEDDGDVGIFVGSGATNMGHAAMIADHDHPQTWWLIGDGITGTNTYRCVVDNRVLAGVGISSTYTVETFTGHKGDEWFIHAGGISNRLYGQESDIASNPPYVGYFDVDTLSWVRLWNPGFVMANGGLVTTSEELWFRGASGSTNQIEVRDRDGTLITTITTPTSAIWRMDQDRTGLVWVWAAGSPVYIYHATTYELLYTSASISSGATLYGFTEDNRSVFLCGNGTNWFFQEVERLPRLTLGTTALSALVTDLCERVGLAASDLDVSELTDTVNGYAVARRDAVRSAIGPLQIAYGFDAVESDNKIVFRKRGRASVATIEEADLAARIDGEKAPAPVANVRRLETELPREVAVQYMDADAHYQVGSQYARRLTGESSDVATLDLPIVLTAAKAAEVAELVLYERWSSRNSQEISVSRKYATLEPTDVITVNTDNVSYLLRIVDKTEAGGLIRLKTVTEDVEVYDPAAGGVALPDVSGSVGVAGPTILRLLDIPLLRDVDDGDAGIYAAACGYYDGWPGAELWVSRDGGSTYERTTTSFLSASVIGTAATALPNFSGGNCWDELSTVEVTVITGELSSLTRAQVLAGGNAAYLGGEIIQFTTATLVSTGRYRLTGLLRGRKGTEQYMTTHAIGESFVMLDSSALKRVALPTSDIGLDLLFKAVTFGQVVAEASAVTFTPAGVGLEPLSPVHIHGGRSANAAYDITIKWIRRGRVSGEWRDFVDVPVGETTESYEIDIIAAGSPTAVARTLTASTNQVTYTSAQQVTDFGSNPSSLTVRVYQMSETVGRGFVGQATITV